MLTLGMCYNYFVKLNFKAYGLQFHIEDRLLNDTAIEGFLMNAVARCIGAFIMWYIGPPFGFRRTYRVVLITEIVMAFTMPYVSHIQFFYRTYVIVTLMCEGVTFSLFTPFAG